jgi:hypothetical protein
MWGVYGNVLGLEGQEKGEEKQGGKARAAWVHTMEI